MSETTTAGEQENVSMPGRERPAGVEEEAAECGEQEVEQELRHDGEWRSPCFRYITLSLCDCSVDTTQYLTVTAGDVEKIWKIGQSCSPL